MIGITFELTWRNRLKMLVASLFRGKLRFTVDAKAFIKAIKEDTALAPAEAGNCTACGEPVFHRNNKPGEYDHECKKPTAPAEANKEQDPHPPRAYHITDNKEQA